MGKNQKTDTLEKKEKWAKLALQNISYPWGWRFFVIEDGYVVE